MRRVEDAPGPGRTGGGVDLLASNPPVSVLVQVADVGAKAVLLLLVVASVVAPELANMEDKAPAVRTFAYPTSAFLVPLLWFVFWRDRVPFPWLADLLVTLASFSDILGNRMDLFDTVVWFDDWMHFMNTGVVSAAVVLLTLERTATRGAVLERALAFGMTASMGWELAEYFAFLNKTTDARKVYIDTLGDLGVGAVGIVVAALTVHAAWHQGLLRTTPVVEPRH